MTSGNTTATPSPVEAGAEMPQGEMAAPPGPSIDMPGGGMPGEEQGAFTPATAEMPRGEMGEPSAGVLAGLSAGLGAGALSDMPGGEMSGIEVGGALDVPAIEISGTWTLQLASSVLKSGGAR